MLGKELYFILCVKKKNYQPNVFIVHLGWENDNSLHQHQYSHQALSEPQTRERTSYFKVL